MTKKFSSLLLCAAALVLAGCTQRPPEDVVKQNVEQLVKTKQAMAFMLNPDGTRIEGYKITNTYKQGEGIVYEFEAQVSIKSRVRGVADQSGSVSGAVLFRKLGDRWDASPVR